MRKISPKCECYCVVESGNFKGRAEKNFFAALFIGFPSEQRMSHKRPVPFKKPPLRIQPTTLWDYPSQHYGDSLQGDPKYKGATPSYIVWNLLQRYTKTGDLVIDPC